MLLDLEAKIESMKEQTRSSAEAVRAALRQMLSPTCNAQSTHALPFTHLFDEELSLTDTKNVVVSHPAIR